MGRFFELADGTRIHRVDHGGDGAPILLVHGMGGSSADWTAVAGPLSGVGNVVAMDLPRFGVSPPTRARGLEGMTRAVEAVLADLVSGTGRRAVLVGNSMGGLISTFVAARHPDLVAGMILVNPAYPPRPGDFPRLHRATALRLALQAAPGTGELVDAWLHRLEPRERVMKTLQLVAHRTDRIPAAAVEALVAVAEQRQALPWARGAVPAAARSITAVWAKPSRMIAGVRQVTCPTLVVQGEADNLVPPAAVARIAGLRSDWELAVMEDTGHVPQLDAHDRFLDLVTPWIRGLASPAVP
jgi:pimeloyl-ACP methyl ester carboxylesterase